MCFSRIINEDIITQIVVEHIDKIRSNICILHISTYNGNKVEENFCFVYEFGIMSATLYFLKQHYIYCWFELILL